MVSSRISMLVLGVAVAVLGMIAIWATFGPPVLAVFQVIPGN